MEHEGPHKTTVLVTGFGPFGEHLINSSSVAVQELSKLGLSDCQLITAELPVSYQHVSEAVPRLHKLHRPDLVVHVGVSSIAECLTIEKRARNHGYSVKKDIHGLTKPDDCCIATGPTEIVNPLDIEAICAEVNDSADELRAVVSHDAGQYLCEYIYYTTLCVCDTPCIFIHVPIVGEQSRSAQQLGRGLKHIIVVTLQHIQPGPG